MHVDYYHNLYAVTQGVKEWTLLPPFARALLDEQTYVSATWRCSDEDTWQGDWRLEEDQGDGGEARQTSWITEPKDTKVGLEKSALDRLTSTLRLEAGQILYLPPLWYHAVETRGQETAVVSWERW